MVLPQRLEFHCPVKIISGDCALENLPGELAEMGASRPLLVTDRSRYGRRAVSRVTDAFRGWETGVAVCDRFSAPVDNDLLEELAGRYHDLGGDAIIAVGSGRLVHAAKLLTALVAGNGPAAELPGVVDRIDAPLGPLFLVPAAPGDGYEAAGGVLAGDRWVVSQFMAPDRVVIDPRMMGPATVRVVANAGLAALTHAVECGCGPDSILPAGAYAAAALELLRHHLAAAVGRPGDRRESTALANAEAMAAGAFSGGAPGPAHLLGSAAAQHCGHRSGILMGIVLPAALEYQIENGGGLAVELQVPLLGREQFALGAPNLRTLRALGGVHEILYAVQEAAGGKVPSSLQAAGVPREKLGEIAAACAGRIPALPDVDACRTILGWAWHGGAGEVG